MSTPHEDDPLLGARIDGKYQLVSRLGAGGMGKVYRADQMSLGRAVAVKVLDASASHREADPALERRFFLEASLCAKLSHPNVVTVHDYGRAEIDGISRLYLVMELLGGETLHRRLQRGPTPMEPREAVAIAVEVGRGLRAAHRAGLIHRDLKPGNIMLSVGEDEAPSVKILDFGLVKQVEGDLREDITQEGTFLGSPRYMAPEQVAAGAVDARCDLYALGVILFQCLTGKPPFDGRGSMEVLMQHINSPVPAMRAKNPAVEIDPDLEAVVRKLLEKRPEARFEDADALVVALREWLTSSRGDATVAARSQTGPVLAPGSPSAPVAVDLTGTPSSVPSVEPSGSLLGAAIPRFESSVPSPAARRPSALAISAVGAVALLVAVGIAALRPGRSAGGDAARTASRVPESSIATVADAGAPAEGPIPASRGMLHIESDPAGAVVREGEAVLGPTPMDVAIEPSGPARSFSVGLAGHAPFAFVQQPTSDRVRVFAPLQALRAPGGSPGDPDRAPRPPVTRPPVTRPPVTRPANPRPERPPTSVPGDEIRLTR